MRLEFELTYSESAMQDFSHYTISTPLVLKVQFEELFWISFQTEYLILYKCHL